MRFDETGGGETAEDFAGVFDREESEAGELCEKNESAARTGKGRRKERRRTCFSSSFPLASIILQHLIAVCPSFSLINASTKLLFIAFPSVEKLTLHLACVPSPCCKRNISLVAIPH